jgi:hypothetical protein
MIDNIMLDAAYHHDLIYIYIYLSVYPISMMMMIGWRQREYEGGYIGADLLWSIAYTSAMAMDGGGGW